MLIRTKHGEIVQLGHWLASRNISFPLRPTDAILADLEIERVNTNAPQPDHDPLTQKAVADGFEEVGGRWQNKWKLVDLSAEEIERKTQDAADSMRRIRNARLTECDWTQLPDATVSNPGAWAAYRQALREVTDQPGFPHRIDWPEKP